MTFTANRNKQSLARRDFLRLAGISGLLSLFLKLGHSIGWSRAAIEPRDFCPAQGNGMNPKNTFASFFVGSCNRFAHAAAWAVAQSPAKAYNPLLFHGAADLGKTHLAQAIGWRAASLWSARVLYLSGERFTDEFVGAIKTGAVVKFRRRCRQADILILDDFEGLAGRETQEEFLQLFNTLFDGRKQIILSGLRLPSETANLDPRLAARFEWGLTAELRPPDIETQRAITRIMNEATLA